MEKFIDREARRRGVKARIRRKVVGDPDRPRLVVFKSDRHIYVQAVDDSAGRTLAASSTMDKDIRGKSSKGGNVAAAREVGGSIARKLKDLGLQNVVFDRGGYVYHGRIKALAEAAREGGLRF